MRKFIKHGLKKYSGLPNSWSYFVELEDTSKLSPWLANGSLSVRKVYWEVMNDEEAKSRK